MINEWDKIVSGTGLKKFMHCGLSECKVLILVSFPSSYFNVGLSLSKKKIVLFASMKALLKGLKMSFSFI